MAYSICLAIPAWNVATWPVTLREGHFSACTETVCSCRWHTASTGKAHSWTVTCLLFLLCTAACRRYACLASLDLYAVRAVDVAACKMYTCADPDSAKTLHAAARCLGAPMGLSR